MTLYQLLSTVMKESENKKTFVFKKLNWTQKKINEKYFVSWKLNYIPFCFYLVFEADMVATQINATNMHEL